MYTFESTNDATLLRCYINIINNSSTSQESATACDSYDWNGTTYTESGTYTFESTNEFGCVHVSTLNLIINNSSTSAEDVTACDSYNWNGVTYTESGAYEYNTLTVNGCDSLAYT